jgi:hypothetical protein
MILVKFIFIFRVIHLKTILNKFRGYVVLADESPGKL